MAKRVVAFATNGRAHSEAKQFASQRVLAPAENEKAADRLRLLGGAGRAALAFAWLHVRLQIVRQGHILDQALLGFQPVDRFFAVLEKFFQQIAAHVVLQILTQRDGLNQQGALDFAFILEIALQAFDHMLANQQLAEILQVGQTFQEEHALDDFVGLFMTRIDCLYW